MNQYNAYVLVVEDDKQIRNFICYSLDAEDFKHIACSSGQSALSLLITEPVDLMLLDLGLPDFDGMEVIRKVREWSEMPIIVVSARDQDKEKVAALDLGADDYLTKPFSATELLARIRVALRHLYRQNSGYRVQNILQVGELQIDLDKRLIYLEGEETHVTPMEYNLLVLLFKNIGKVLTTKQILKEVWGVGYSSDTQALRALMAGLRRKIEKNPAKPRYILTEIGVGYRLVDE
ncbi:MAG: response regulator [Clostridiales bacterium]